MTKTVTLLFLRRGDELLLAMKKRGFGQGRWNGVGGKVEPNESIEEALVRECQEEIGVTPLAPRPAGRLHFFEKKDPQFHHDCHIFISDTWEGVPQESEEMRPQWFHASDIPYSSMWADDVLWLPQLLQNRRLIGTITLDGGKIHSHDITVG